MINLPSKSLGIVLSGGGSKGIAHAETLQFLSEQNIIPSEMAGTSAGAIVAALYCFGKSLKKYLSF